MSTLTLPGDIPGLLRRGSPITDGKQDGVCVHREPRDGYWQVCDGLGARYIPPRLLRLDLTDATARAHAAWWALPKNVQRAKLMTQQHGRYQDLDDWRSAHALLLDAAIGRQVDTAMLRRIVLDLANRRDHVLEAS